ncbi:hypothetical protein [Nitrosopumilus adriaticus]|uniref:Uncharacterized protein n=1 Tax=Nitrosopumilus adriaticus TaxID=1580092 RepID=A0A0D5C0A6_9ARCH|nr:hypothetical protein [Nitrosopumilus adriaticus]AJW70239.1 hypothetical protein NADRNF5_0543 [Nitrosopumilus adriaticus]
MPAICRGVCHKYKSSGVSMQFKYQEGQKRCSFCGIFMVYNETRCPCCHTILRTKARDKLSKLKYKTNYQ